MQLIPLWVCGRVVDPSVGMWACSQSICGYVSVQWIPLCVFKRVVDSAVGISACS